VTEYRRHTRGCLGCGAVSQAGWPVDMPTSRCGHRLQATVGYLTGRVGMSQREVQDGLATVFHLEVGLGSIAALEQAVSTAVAASVEEASRYLQRQPMRNVEETPWWERAKHLWLWVKSTPLVTVFHLLKSRGAVGARAVSGEEFPGAVGTDESAKKPGRWEASNSDKLPSRLTDQILLFTNSRLPCVASVPCWRRLLVGAETSVADLHHILQLVLGWTNSHLHRFVIHGKEYGIAYEGGMGFADDAKQIRLADCRFRLRERFLYEYDFADKWQHDLRVEQILEVEARRSYPVCTGCKRAAPPEECGERRSTWPGGDTGSMTFSVVGSETASGIQSKVFLQTMRTRIATTLAMTLTISTAVRSMPSCGGGQREEDKHEDASTGGH
jgi:Plasmid pRiA4b ORF-3-like protein